MKFAPNSIRPACTSLTLTLQSNLTLLPRTVAPLQLPVRSVACARDADPALGIVDHLRRGFARFKLGAHLLDLRCLLFKTGSEGLYFFLFASQPLLPTFQLCG